LAGRNYPGGSRNDSRREHDDEQANDNADDDASAEGQDRCRPGLGQWSIPAAAVLNGPSDIRVESPALRRKLLAKRRQLVELEHVWRVGPLAFATFVVGSHFVSSNWPG
jgi:hypothetical protein